MRVDRRRCDRRLFIDFSGPQQRRNREMLNGGQQQSGRHARERRRGNDLPQHGRARSMTGKAGRVSRIMGTVVDFLGLRKTGAVDEQEPEQGGEGGGQ